MNDNEISLLENKIESVGTMDILYHKYGYKTL